MILRSYARNFFSNAHEVRNWRSSQTRSIEKVCYSTRPNSRRSLRVCEVRSFGTPLAPSNLALVAGRILSVLLVSLFPIGRSNSKAYPPKCMPVRLCGFRLLQAGMPSKPDIDGERIVLTLSEMTNVSGLGLIHMLQLASKTGAFQAGEYLAIGRIHTRSSCAWHPDENPVTVRYGQI